MSDTAPEKELRKQAAEVDAWKTIQRDKGSGFMQGERPTGDLAPYVDTVIIDVGSGPRPSVEFFPAHAAFMLDCCMHAYREEGLMQESSLTDTCCGNIMAEALPLRAGCVDHVIAKNMLDHTHDPARVVDEFWRVLRPGGFLHLTVDIGGEPNECEPCVFTEEDIDHLFEGFDLIGTSSTDSSNTGRKYALERSYLKPHRDDARHAPASSGTTVPGEELALEGLFAGGPHARYLPYLACPVTHGPLLPAEDGLWSPLLGAAFPIRDRIYALDPAAAVPRAPGAPLGDRPRARGPVVTAIFPEELRPWRDTRLRIRGLHLDGEDLEVRVGATTLDVLARDRHELECDLTPLIDRVQGAATVSVRTRDGLALASRPLLLAPRPPRITGVSPRSGRAGTALTLRGEKLVVDPGHLGVYLNGIPCAIREAAPDRIVCTVPERRPDHPHAAELAVGGPHGASRLVAGFRYDDAPEDTP